ncbi:MAG TPA: hypothetical protein DEB24_06225 [Coriobacteriia bacterium]|nr:hypothetical protein [Coriobacteriia bacterium]
MRKSGDSQNLQFNLLDQYSIKGVLITAGFTLTILVELLYTWGGWVFGTASAVSFQSLLLIWSVPHQITNALVFLLLAFVGGKLYRKHFCQVLVVSAVLIVGGHLLLEVGIPGIDPTFGFIAAALLIGSGCSLILGAWVVIFAGNTTSLNRSIILVALVIYAVLYLLVSYLPSFILMLTPPVLTVIVVAIALYLHRIDADLSVNALGNEVTAESDTTPRLPVARTVVLLRDPLFCAASIVFAVPMTRISALMDSVSIATMNMVTAFATIILVGTLLIFHVGPGKSRTLFRDFDIPQLVRFSLPLVATALVLYTLLGSALALPVSVAVFVLFYLVWLLMIPTCIETARQLGVSPLLCYGVAGFVINLLFAASTWLAALLIADGLVFGVATISVCMLLVLYVLMMVLTFNRKSLFGGLAAKTDDEANNTERAGSPEHATPEAPGNPKAPEAPPREPEAPQAFVDRRSPYQPETICMGLAKKHQLTPREHDILVLLASGRDAPYIANQLYISKNTVRTHKKSVYVKLNVHSHQELLDLLEEKRNSPYPSKTE